MPSADHLRRSIGFVAVTVAALVGILGLAGEDRGVAVELSRASIVEPAPVGDVVSASATGTTPPAADATSIDDMKPTTTTSPPPAPSPAPAVAPSPVPTPAPAPQPAPATTASTRNPGCEASMTRWMNEARSAHGIPAVVSDGRIHPIALRWTDTMAQRQDLDHNPNFGDQIFGARPEARTAGENVGRGSGSDRGLFDAFMASPGHRSKILGVEFSHATVACTVDAGGQAWATMNFWG